MACKVSVWPLALFLPLAAYIHIGRRARRSSVSTCRLFSAIWYWQEFWLYYISLFHSPMHSWGRSFLQFQDQSAMDQRFKNLANQSTGNVDVPYALQWARRPITFSLTNLVQWGVRFAAWVFWHVLVSYGWAGG